jgi:tRNA pseudouridine13 synthase
MQASDFARAGATRVARLRQLFMSSARSLPRVSFKTSPEDFRVEEVPSYEPQGKGDHVYVRFEKTNLTTDEAARRIARGAGANPRDTGVAGLKDKVGVTTQQISLFLPENKRPDLGALERLEIDGVKILSVKRHGNKLKTGHLVGNRFAIALRDVPPSSRDEIVSALERAGHDGVPNAYGKQRFGRDDDNDARALAWLRDPTGADAPRDPKKRRFLFSALQSRAFNEVLEARVEGGTWKTPIAGDVLCVHKSGGMFASEDLVVERERAERGEISPTGPMPGATMKRPSGAAAELEDAIVARIFGAGFDFERVRALGEGTRRPFRVMVENMRVEREETGILRVYFVLPKGAYATTVLACAVDAVEPVKSAGTAELEPDGAAPTDVT